MKIVRFIHSLLFYIYVVISFLVFSTIGLTLSIFAKDKPEFLFRFSKFWCKYIVLPFIFIKVKISGINHIPKDKPVIFASNHGSYLDIPIYLAYIPGSFRFIVKKEFMNIPFIGGYTRLSGHISIDRESGISAHKTLKETTNLLRNKISIIIFPEGTRTRDGKLGKFKRGGLMLALETNSPIVPLGISGSFKAMPRGRFIINPERIKVNIGKPVYFDKIDVKNRNSYDECLKYLKNQIEELLEK